MSSLGGPLFNYRRAQMSPVTYPFDDMSRSELERDYLRKLAQHAEKQNLSQDLRAYVDNLSIGFTVFAAFIVALRFLARYRAGAKFLVDDYLMLFSLVLLFGNMAYNLMLTRHGLGLHSGALAIEELQFLDRVMIGAEIIYVTAVNMYKIALLFLYFRIFPVRQVRIGGYICGGVSTGWNIACIVAASVQCVPLHRLWSPWVPGGCINLFLTQLCISIPSILADIAILALPIPHVLRLQMNSVQRALIIFIFLLGSYVVFTSIYRFRIYLDFTKDDVPYTLAKGCAWNVVEISSGIVSACLPTLGPLIRWLFKGVIPTTVRSGNKYPSAGNSALQTIGGTGPNPADGRRSSNEWSKLPGSESREDAKYGVSMATINRGDSRDGSSSAEIELVPRNVKGDMKVAVEGASRSATGKRTLARSPKQPHHKAASDYDARSSGDGDEYPLTSNQIWKHQVMEQKVEVAKQ